MLSALCRFDVELPLLWREATCAAESISFFIGGQNQVDRAHVAPFIRSSTKLRRALPISVLIYLLLPAFVSVGFHLGVVLHSKQLLLLFVGEVSA
jgi:hypothetical protein